MSSDAVGAGGPEAAESLKPGISIVIPARNEERTIGQVIEKALPYGDEILVVDGHSRDRTAHIARACGVRVLTDHGRGKGDALRVGAAAVRHEITVFMDADGSHDPADIPRLVAPIRAGRADLVIGSRGTGGSDELHGDIEKLLRLIGSDIILIGINLRWRQRLTDSQNGFRAIRTEVVRSLGLRENLTTIEQEMTMKCLKKGYVVAEVPSHEYARRYGASTIRLRRVWLRYLYTFVKYLF